MSEARNRLANQKAKGKRPYFLDNADAERVLNVVLALAQEHAVLRERVDTLERLLQSKGVLAIAEIENFKADAELSAVRSTQMNAYLSKLLRIYQQDAESRTGDAASATIEELARD